MKLILATALLALSLTGCAGGGGNILAGGGASTSANSSTWSKEVWRDAERNSGG